MYGEPRMTHDVDFVVRMKRSDIANFMAAFPEDEYYCPPEEVVELELRRGLRGHCKLISHATGSAADSYFAYDDLHTWSLQISRRVALGSLTVEVASPEYVILRNTIEGELIDRRSTEMGLTGVWQHVKQGADL
jgi:hypothetical protein